MVRLRWSLDKTANLGQQALLVSEADWGLALTTTNDNTPMCVYEWVDGGGRQTQDRKIEFLIYFGEERNPEKTDSKTNLMVYTKTNEHK